jgi:AbrB family looped-hinge helix DNA binding protein
MKRLRISKGGQVSIPAEVRHRWGTHTVVAEDEGDRLVLRPVPDDPISAARGALAGSGITSDEARRQARLDEQAAENRRVRAR